MSRARWFGFNAPFRGGIQNVMSRQVDERLIKNDILQILLTVPGERVMRPTFGTELKTALFEQMTSNQLEDLENEIREKVNMFEGRAILTDINIEGDPDNNAITVKVFGFLETERFDRSEDNANVDLLIELTIPLGSVGVI